MAPIREVYILPRDSLSDEPHTYEIVEENAPVRNTPIKKSPGRRLGKNKNPRIICSKGGMVVLVGGSILLVLIIIAAIALGVYYGTRRNGVDPKTLSITRDLRIAWKGSEKSGWAQACHFQSDLLSSRLIEGARCGDLCNETPGCTHFAWYQTSLQVGNCSLMGGIVSKSDAVFNDDVTKVCGIVSREIEWNPDPLDPGYFWASSCTFQKPSMEEIKNFPGESCGGRCKSSNGCTHFAWTSESKGTCKLKSGTISKDDAIFTGVIEQVCGVTGKEIKWQDVDGESGWSNGCKFTTNPSKTVNLPGEKCGGECFNYKPCTHFLWTKTDNQIGQCRLMEGKITKEDAIYTGTDTMTCGIVKRETTTTISPSTEINWKTEGPGDFWAFGCNFSTPDFTSKAADTGATCGPDCATVKGCTHYVFDGQTCRIKKGQISKENAIPANSNFVCGIRPA